MTNPNKLPHCKTIAHLVVTLGNETASTRTVTATHIDRMSCKNDAGYMSDGIVISSKKDPLDGLHLFPDAASWLAGQLDAHALSAVGNQTVIISHTIDKIFTKFIALTPPQATALATAIKNA